MRRCCARRGITPSASRIPRLGGAHRGAHRLFNIRAVVRWNSDKHYLARLAALAVPDGAEHFLRTRRGCRADAAAVPRRTRRRGAGREARRRRRLARHPPLRARGGGADARAHATASRGRRSVLLQPYLPSVDREGETALIYFDGRFSHAIRKGPLLPSGAPRRGTVRRRGDHPPHARGRRAGRRGPDPARCSPSRDLLYARVDLIRDAAGEPRLLELELTEPSLFFRTPRVQPSDSPPRRCNASRRAEHAVAGSRTGSRSGSLSFRSRAT